MKFLFVLLTFTTLFAQETHKLPMPQATPSVAAASTTNDKNILIIEPKARAGDFVQAFDLLRKDKPTLKIMLRTSNHLIVNVTDITASTGGTLMYIKTLSNQGTRIQVVPLEEIMEIAYSP
ncbi:MAG: hypothetical protein COT85_00855 [Chlamydiae bacterium CG10_big_fil_rev_8_21_14_0_10_42_34]|nr:MAG: hypothetical protein COT85_00855 [Chlamydiae bacterium CG10_big_fil_rev_8_21_14_0_10_42_34]